MRAFRAPRAINSDHTSPNAGKNSIKSVHTMQDFTDSRMRTKRFTVAEANAMLPLVASIASDIRDIFTQVTGRRVDLHRLLRKGARNAGVQYDDEVAESRADLHEEYEKIWQYREELESLGVCLANPESGSIEFPATKAGQEIFLCWEPGQEQIQFYRNADSQRSNLRPLDVLENA